MAEIKPPTLNYRGVDSPRRGGQPNAMRRFYISFAVALGVSTWWWFLGVEKLANQTQIEVALILPVLKVVVGMILIFFPKSRTIGQGLIVSLPFGFLIFVGACFAKMRM